MLFLCLPLLSLSQGQIGIKGGYIHYWFTVPEDGIQYDYNYSHSAYSINISLKQRTSHTFNQGLEIVYTNRSFAVKSSDQSPGGSETVDYSYSIGNIYLQFRPQFSFGSRIKFFVYPGFYFGTLLNSSIQGTKSYWHIGETKTNTINGSANDYYPNFEFGILFGAGIEVPVYKNLSIVYENNFSLNLLPVANAWGSEKIKMLNLNFEIGLAYTFTRKTSKSNTK